MADEKMKKAPNMNTTLMGQAVTFVTGPRTHPTPRPSAPTPRATGAMHAVQDHPASPWFAALVGVGGIVFGILWPGLTPMWRAISIVFGLVMMPGVPASFAAGVGVVAPAVRMVLDLVRGNGKPK
jgi:hypothetical protein